MKRREAQDIGYIYVLQRARTPERSVPITEDENPSSGMSVDGIRTWVEPECYCEDEVKT